MEWSRVEWSGVEWSGVEDDTGGKFKWNEEKYKNNVANELLISEEKYNDLDEDLTSLLRSMTEGDTRDMIDAAS